MHSHGKSLWKAGLGPWEVSQLFCSLDLLQFSPVISCANLLPAAMQSFVVNCQELVTEDVTRRLLPPLECALTLTARLVFLRISLYPWLQYLLKMCLQHPKHCEDVRCAPQSQCGNGTPAFVRCVGSAASWLL